MGLVFAVVCVLIGSISMLLGVLFCIGAFFTTGSFGMGSSGWIGVGIVGLGFLGWGYKLYEHGRKKYANR